MAVSSVTIILLVAYAAFAYVAIILYRLLFHRLARFPGPKLAAATGWYEFYYDVVKGGQFYREIRRMHEKYGMFVITTSSFRQASHKKPRMSSGSTWLTELVASSGPIVRINPEEVHILDTNFYDEIYAPVSKKRDKYPDWVVFLGVPTGVFATCPHEHHRQRREALNLSFSKKAIYEIEHLIQEQIGLLCNRFDKIAESNTTVRLDAAFFALANDIITLYTFGESYKCLGQDDFQQGFKHILLSAVEAGAFIRQFPWIIGLVRRIPLWVLHHISGDLAAILNWESIVHKRVETLLETRKLGRDTGSATVFTRLLNSDLPDHEKSFQRLVDEGKSLMGAGSETTSWTLTMLMWYLTNDKEILHNLRHELIDMPRNGTGGSLLKWLGKRPYLVRARSAPRDRDCFDGR